MSNTLTPACLVTPGTSWVTVLPAASKGLGLFSKVFIPANTKFFYERALFTINDDEVHRSYAVPAMFPQLSPEDATAFRDLSSFCISHKYHYGEADMDICRWDTNAHNLTYRRASAIFLIASRSNHGCQANAAWSTDWVDDDQEAEESWNGKKGYDVISFQAQHDIEEGEEITTSYGHTSLGLWEKYGFECECGACPGVTDGEISVNTSTEENSYGTDFDNEYEEDNHDSNEDDNKKIDDGENQDDDKKQDSDEKKNATEQKENENDENDADDEEDDEMVENDSDSA